MLIIMMMLELMASRFFSKNPEKRKKLLNFTNHVEQCFERSVSTGNVLDTVRVVENLSGKVFDAKLAVVLIL